MTILSTMQYVCGTFAEQHATAVSSVNRELALHEPQDLSALPSRCCGSSAFDMLGGTQQVTGKRAAFLSHTSWGTPDHCHLRSPCPARATCMPHSIQSPGAVV